MKNNGYLTVKELADTVGISKQAIYKRLSTDLQPFVILVENKKCLKYNVLKKFQSTKQSTETESLTEVENKLIELLQSELEIKNKQISEMQKLLDQEQQLRMAEHQKVLMLETKKKGFFKRLTNKKID